MEGKHIDFEKQIPIFILKKHVKIYRVGKVPKLEGFEEVPGFIKDAYPDKGSYDDESDYSRLRAVNMTVRHLDVPFGDVLEHFEVCITPGPCGTGLVWCKRINRVN